MALEVVGSSPTTHPTFFCCSCRDVGVSPSGKARDFDSRIRKVRILPPQPFDPLAQLVEHLTFNQGAWGSNPQWVTMLRVRAPSASPFALVAQSVEQETENLRVGGSIPPQGTIYAVVAQW